MAFPTREPLKEPAHLVRDALIDGGRRRGAGAGAVGVGVYRGRDLAAAAGYFGELPFGLRPEAKPGRDGVRAASAGTLLVEALLLLERPSGSPGEFGVLGALEEALGEALGALGQCEGDGEAHRGDGDTERVGAVVVGDARDGGLVPGEKKKGRNECASQVCKCVCVY